MRENLIMYDRRIIQHIDILNCDCGNLCNAVTPNCFRPKTDQETHLGDEYPTKRIGNGCIDSDEVKFNCIF